MADDLNIEEYVRRSGGTRVIKKVLIANNGIAAVKAIRSIRKWSYETFANEREVEFVVMATPEDLRANAEYIRLADEFVEVPGGANNNNYANVHLIVQLAEQTGADAVWAGWGHASENPKLPDSLALTANKVVWIGPPPSAMRALGDKIGSTIIAQSANVAVLGWSGDGLAVDYIREGLPDDIYKKATVSSPKEAIAAAKRIGFPVMIKASEGGGGKGIRKVLSEEEVERAFSQVAGEVPGSPIFLMKLATSCRHLEVQLLADNYGNAIALSGRDCSIQRRHQKIIEEGPVTAASPDVWRQMEQAAVRLAKTVSYSNAGTVEYLYMSDGTYCFLELNPRLQVEHPVTELVTGVNLPAAQLNVAMGLRLDRIPDIRRLYGKSIKPEDYNPLDFDALEPVPHKGHVIAARITAENPDQGFQPTSGTIQELTFRSTPSVWGYFSMGAVGRVHEFADSQFGHLFSFGESRDVSRKNLVMALKELTIRGDIRTTVEYLVKMLETDSFRKNETSTEWLEKLLQTKQSQQKSVDVQIAVFVAALYKADHIYRSKVQEYISLLEKGQVPSKTLLALESFVELIYDDVKYQLKAIRCGPNSIMVDLNGSVVQADVRPLGDGGLLVSGTFDNKARSIYAKEEAGGLRVTVEGTTFVFTKEYDPSVLKASVSGKLVRYLVEDGAHVNSGQPYAEIEVMKMIMPLLMTESGVVHFSMPEGRAFEAGNVLGRVDLDDGSHVKKAELYKGLWTLDRKTSSSSAAANVNATPGREATAGSIDSLPSDSPPAVPRQLIRAASEGGTPMNRAANRPHLTLRKAVNELTYILLGFKIPTTQIPDLLRDVCESIRNPMTPYYEMVEALSVLGSRMPAAISDELSAICAEYKTAVSAESATVSLTAFLQQEGRGKDLDAQLNTAFPWSRVKNLLESHMITLGEKERISFRDQLASLLQLIDRHDKGPTHHLLLLLNSFVNEFLGVEKLFCQSTKTSQEVIQELRPRFKDDLGNLVTMARAHYELKQRNLLILRILETIAEHGMVSSFANTLHELSALNRKDYSAVSLKARQMLVWQMSPSFQERRDALEKKLIEAASALSSVSKQAVVGKLVGQYQPIFDTLVTFFNHPNRDVRELALEIYIRRAYHSYDVKHVRVSENNRSENSSATSSPTTNKRSMSGSISAGGPIPILSSFSAYSSALSMTPTTSSPNMSGASFSSVSTLSNAFNSLAYLHGIWQYDVPQAAITVDPTHSTPLGALRKSQFPDSYDDLTKLSQMTHKSHPTRTGFAAAFQSLEQFERNIDSILDLLHKNRPASRQAGSTLNQSANLATVLHFFVYSGDAEIDSSFTNDEQTIAHIANILRTRKSALESAGVRRITFMVGTTEQYPGQWRPGTYYRTGYFTFRHQTGYEEDPIYRHVEPSLAYHLELKRMHKFNIRLVPTTNRSIHLYLAQPRPEALEAEMKQNQSMDRNGKPPLFSLQRFFVRMIVRHIQAIPSGPESSSTVDNLFPEPERMFVGGLEALELAQGETEFGKMEHNHLFMNMLPEVVVTPEHVEAIVRHLAIKYEDKLRALNVKKVEIRLCSKVTPYSQSVPIRMIADNPTGHALRVSKYVEVPSSSTGEIIFSSLDSSSGEYHGLPVTHPHSITAPLDEKRYQAAAVETVYVYDFLDLFERAIRSHWKKCPQFSFGTVAMGRPDSSFVPEKVIQVVELVLNSANELEEVQRPVGRNDFGMVAWRLTMCTPEYPKGRQVILIANDITFEMGSFGVKEDTLFKKASELARQEGIPRLYITINSGARIGLAEEVMSVYKVAWIDEKDPSKGFHYLYLLPDDYQKLSIRGAVTAVPEQHPKEGTVYRITDIIGVKDGLGVENLRGSGMIAGETSKAYQETFTLTYVTGRTVGIGAYLTRLGQRVIQKVGPAILLTGFQALNRLMGKDVYTSNQQLGGVEIMSPNGVTHTTVKNDLEGVASIIDWLSYIPARKGAPLPFLQSSDPLDRPIAFKPTSTSYDPRHMLEGVTDANGKWMSGFFDRGSFRESLSDWAKSVVVGRARLGGLPVGVIAVETRITVAYQPADPACPDTQEVNMSQAGQVWYPDSAFKTAQAIRDMSGEDLPLFIFANWRGFSGGQRDMFNQVLKFGSFIVDALVSYTQPVFVYIPPAAELRGGAWVVVDPTINPECMEMYADIESRGGVLEPSGIVEIKYRDRALMATAKRLDPILKSLDDEDKEAVTKGMGTDTPARKDIARRRIQREKELLPIYRSIAVQFADLHDRAGRMKAKQVINEVMEWDYSREFFYWRLRRQLLLFSLRRDIREHVPTLSRIDIMNLLRDWCERDGIDWDHNEEVYRWATTEQHQIGSRVAELRATHIRDSAKKLSTENAKAVLQGLLSSIHDLKNAHPELAASILAEVRGELLPQSSSGQSYGRSSRLRSISTEHRDAQSPVS